MGANYSDRIIEFYDNLLLDLIAKDKNSSRNIYVFYQEMTIFIWNMARKP